jgi:hypothetical protein
MGFVPIKNPTLPFLYNEMDEDFKKSMDLENLSTYYLKIQLAFLEFCLYISLTSFPLKKGYLSDYSGPLVKNSEISKDYF